MTEEKKSAVAPKSAFLSEKEVHSEKKDCFSDFDFSGLDFGIEEMFRAGVHFGHQKSRKNPKMDEYIYTTKNGINIFDLKKTAEKLKEAVDFVEKSVASGQDVLFVGTKKQAKDIVESGARKCGMPYVIERWLGGTFTNFPVISERTRFLRDGQMKMERGDYAKYTKFERMKMSEELEKLEKKMGGIKNMMKLPGAIFTTGIIEDKLAIKEAQAKGIPVIALADSNVDPRGIDFVIPSNEDAVSSIKLLCAYIVKAVLSGKDKKVRPEESEKKEKTN